MKKFLMLILGISLFSIYRLANAGAFVMPVKMWTDWLGVRVEQRIIAWSEDDNTLNPCYGLPECWVGPDVLYPRRTPGLYGSCIEAGNCLQIGGYRTRKEVAEAYNQKFPLPHNFTFTIASSDATCVGLFYIRTRPTMSTAGQGIKWPGSTCGKLPPINQHCSINLPPTIDHGSLSNNNLNGSKKSITGSINCTQAGALKLYSHSSTGEKNIYLNSEKTLYSMTFINGQDGWGGAYINTSGNNLSSPFTFTSELETSGNVKPGNYSGSAVVLLSFL